MHLHRLRLQNFRQHKGAEIVFGPGLTGIIGPNGAGKTTLLEAVTWALFGQKAARDRKETIRWRRAPARADVRVELEFALGPQEFRLTRTLNHAELFLGHEPKPIAQTLAAVGERVERLLAMTYEEFHNTYFTGQRDLAVMRDVGPAERRRFLNRLLGYEKLERAQKRVREHRGGLNRDIETLRLDLPDPAALSADRAARAAEDTAEAQRLTEAEEALAAVRAASDQHLPVFKDLKTFRERHQQLTGDLRAISGELKAAVDTVRQLGERHDAARTAAAEVARLEPQVALYTRSREQLAALEVLARDAETRARIETTIQELDRRRDDLGRRLAHSREAAGVVRAVAERLEAARAGREAAERAYEERKETWDREKTDATVERRKLQDQYKDLRGQRDRVVATGAEGACPTCGRPLGSEYHAVLDLLDSQLEAVTQNGQYYRAKLETLVGVPADVFDLDRQRHALAQAVEAGAQELAVAKRAADEALELEKEDAALTARRAAMAAEAAQLAGGYDRAHHEALRSTTAELEVAARQAERLAATAEQAPALTAALLAAEQQRGALVERFARLQHELDVLEFSEDAYLAAEAEMERLETAWRAAEGAAIQARADRRLAGERLKEAERREQEALARAARLADLRVAVRLHDQLDGALGDLSADLNAEIGPEMGALAGGFLATLTDGQFDELLLDEAFEATVFSDGEAQPVLSGGEQDLRDLTLRLAVSQMIAERSGQPFSLLVLDEIFGSLDDLHRQNVVNLLRGLESRFPQVILITHVEAVRESLDRVLRVRYDEATGASVVSEERGGGTGPGGSNADVAA